MNKTPAYGLVIIFGLLTCLSIAGIEPPQSNRNRCRFVVYDLLKQQSRVMLDSAFNAFKEGAVEDTTHEFPGVYIMKDTNNVAYGKTIGFYRAYEYLRKQADSALYGKINLEN